MNAPPSPVAPGAQYTPVCPACGVIAPIDSAQCESCSRPLARPHVSAAEVGNLHWVALRCTFQCRACEFPFPLEGLVTAEGIDCAQCGSLQRFEVDQWMEALQFAHAVGDLGGRPPEGRFPNPEVWIGDVNPHKDIGKTATFATKQTGRISTDASPGHPICRVCARPLDCQVGHGGRVETRCSGCGAAEHYALPPNAARFTGLVKGVVADEHAAGRRDVKVQATQAGATALVCPQCGAALQGLSGTTAQCAYCKTVAFVPARARPRETGQLVKPTVFWMAFQGPSPDREVLERPVAQQAGGVNVGKVFGRGLSPIPGIELAPPKGGIDLRHWAVVIGLTTLALGVGFFVSMAIAGK